ILKALFWADKHDHKGSWIPKLKDLLNDRWNEFIALDELARELQVHPVTISKYFAKHTGLTLSEYMRKIKVKRAVNLLMNSAKPLVDIAFNCGFSDQSHMNRLVRYYTGYTPSTIRSLV
ncbi:MAG: helix-turn-helix transcriptional regulator, partial [Bacteroidota bacterium]